ncbi:MAG TPA: glycoside hydrolase family 15 protein [Thermoanaerobaculia bacterium]|nr:glycoside hydrolase family 15 protein [Thermoanaerobaculia bacterium]
MHDRSRPAAPVALTEPYPPIGDYALIGDCRTAALVSRAGSLDWLCLPRFDSPAVFSALLDWQTGGRFFVRPRGPFAVSRRYLGRTNLLETTFETPGGVLCLTDSMSVADMDERRREMRVEHEVLRRVECLAGEVEVEVGCDPRPLFGQGRALLQNRRKLGFAFAAGPQVLILQSEVPLHADGAGRGVVGYDRLWRGERRFLSLIAESGGPAAIPLLGAAAAARLERSRLWWETWAGRCRYDGPFPEAVLRSILLLKLLTYAPSGAVIAAPTTSLPEAIGGPRNWDYRYCWPRDASWTLTAFFDLGYQEEGKAFLSWLLYATRMRHPELGVLYDVHGESRIPEYALATLDGYRGSRPVRVGNGASGQLQLDVYGELVESACEFVSRGGELDRPQARLLARLGETACRLWREPDEGIWEKRSGRFHHTFSKMMCWVALDRLLAMDERGKIALGRSRERFARECREIRHAIETAGWSDRLGSYVDVLGEEGADASLLLLGIYGFVDPRGARFRSTFAHLDRTLGAGDLLYRYPPGTDGLPGGEAAFAICSFWAVEALARMGEVERATERFAHLLAYGNDVGLFAEQIDAASGQFLGNFPQAFSHLGLINAALTLAQAEGAEAPAATAGQTGARV